jgi:hypothetical protein
VRVNRTKVERELDDATRQADTARRDVAAQADLAGSRAQNLVQSGVTAGTTLAAKLTERAGAVL